MLATGCATAGASRVEAAGSVRPGISALPDDSLHLIRGRALGLLTNQTGIDEHGVSDIERLRDGQARAAGVRLTVLFSPEHGIRGTEDRTNLASGIDERSGLVVHSLYTVAATTSPDSTLRGLDALVVVLRDIGTRTWTYAGSMLYAMRVAARNLVLHHRARPPRPARRGVVMSGPILDRSPANAEKHTAARPGRA